MLKNETPHGSRGVWPVERRRLPQAGLKSVRETGPVRVVQTQPPLDPNASGDVVRHSARRGYSGLGCAKELGVVTLFVNEVPETTQVFSNEPPELVAQGCLGVRVVGGLVLSLSCYPDDDRNEQRNWAPAPHSKMIRAPAIVSSTLANA